MQTLDDAAHRHRKAMFLALLSAARVARLGAMFRQDLHRTAQQWSKRPQIVLYDEVQQVLTRCVCAWSGVPLTADELPKRTAQLVAMFDWAGRGGMKHVRSRLARHQTEPWICSLIEQTRAARLKPAEDSALERIA